MSASLITIVLIVTPPGAPWGDTGVMSRAIRQVVDADVSVSVQSSPPPDPEAVAIGRKAHADIVAEVQWVPETRTTATLHIYLARGERWIDRTIHFDPLDAPFEQARTIGFAVASILPESPQPPGARSVEPPPSPVAPAQPVQGPAPAHGGFVGALDGCLAAATGIAGYGGGYGGALGAGLVLSPQWSVRLGVVGRVGEIEPAQATTNALQALLGLRYGPFARSGAPVGWGARLDAGAMRYEIVHLSWDDDAPDHRAGWTPVFAASLEGSLLIREGFEAVGTAGAEVVPGRGRVYSHFENVADLAVVRVALALGARVRF